MYHCLRRSIDLLMPEVVQREFGQVLASLPENSLPQEGVVLHQVRPVVLVCISGLRVRFLRRTIWCTLRLQANLQKRQLRQIALLLICGVATFLLLARRRDRNRCVV